MYYPKPISRKRRHSKTRTPRVSDSLAKLLLCYVNSSISIEAEMMRKLASFVGDNPVPSAHYTKPTIASVQCFTSFHEKLLPSGKVDKCFIHLIKIALLICLRLAVGLGFAFASDLLFTAVRTPPTSSREKQTLNTALPAYTYQTRPTLPHFSIL